MKWEVCRRVWLRWLPCRISRVACAWTLCCALPAQPSRRDEETAERSSSTRDMAGAEPTLVDTSGVPWDRGACGGAGQRSRQRSRRYWQWRSSVDCCRDLLAVLRFEMR
eukprot:jgi/Ulvmu1/3239/UM150_0012.1